MLTDACGDDRARLAAALRGVRVYQDHPYRRALPDMPVVARAGGSTIRDYGGVGPTVLFVPSPINPPTVLDLMEGNSLLRWLSEQGLRVLLLDWGEADDDWRAAGLDTLVERLATLIAATAPAAVAGYCLGGTLALAAPVAVPHLALLATPWHFDGYSAAQRSAIARHAAATRELSAGFGAYPVELLQPGFWALDREAVVNKFVRLAGLDPADPRAAAFVALEDWTNEGTPLPLRAARDLFDDLFAQDRSGRGEWQLGGRMVAPPDVPILNVTARRDRLVPPATALRAGTRLDLDAGHVGMIVGGRAREQLWEPLAKFLRGD
ncbi:alpha/beta hydrolase [Glacieibacterium frigidum]|uniref:Alpha/beta hydrolase n=1 Tax=Glacieibacterium frigidum TaxID=2593303 RepID=A0A552UJV6_9SPHN|nr:alpha/beta hydrolase [Glacieibacterium frigidum]